MVQVNVKQVEDLNKKAQFMNGERNKQIGQQEAARQAYEKAIFAYKTKFGIQLDDTNLQQEFNDVSTKLNSDFEAQNMLILSIESGEYRNQQQTAVTIPAQQTQTVQIPQNDQQVQLSQGQQVQNTQQVEQTIQAINTFAPTPEAEPQRVYIDPSLITQTTPPQPTFGFGQPAPTQAQPENAQTGGLQQNTDDKQDVSEQPFTPTGWGAPTKDINANFQNLMGGQKFGQ
jgi:hypothetical protein